MGNCIRKESQMQWGGEDWGSPAPDGFDFATNTRQSNGRKLDKATNMETKDEELLGGDQRGSTSASPSIDSVPNKASTSELKIKITRKQLEELLARVEVKGLSVQQVLTQLINVGHDQFSSETSSVRSSTVWRPNLRRIPE